MNKFQRIREVIIAFLIILFSIILIANPDDGHVTIAAVLSTTMILAGLRQLFYYFTMARHMVGGMRILFRALITLDFGLLTFTVVDIPRFYVLLYLLVVHAFSGFIGILRGLEAKRFGSPSWRLIVLYGATVIILTIFCLIYVKSANMLVYYYCASLISSALVRLRTAFRKSAIVYIQ